MNLHEVANPPRAFTATFWNRETGQAKVFWVFEELPEGWKVGDVRSGHPVDVEPEAKFISINDWTRDEKNTLPAKFGVDWREPIS